MQSRPGVANAPNSWFVPPRTSNGGLSILAAAALLTWIVIAATAWGAVM